MVVNEIYHALRIDWAWLLCLITHVAIEIEAVTVPGLTERLRGGR